MDINTLGLMTGTEASQRWGLQKNYIPLLIKRNPRKIEEIKGDYCYIGSSRGKTMVITRKGMEKLTGMTEREAQEKFEKKKLGKGKSINKSFSNVKNTETNKKMG